MGETESLSEGDGQKRRLGAPEESQIGLGERFKRNLGVLSVILAIVVAVGGAIVFLTWFFDGRFSSMTAHIESVDSHVRELSARSRDDFSAVREEIQLVRGDVKELHGELNYIRGKLATVDEPDPTVVPAKNEEI